MQIIRFGYEGGFWGNVSAIDMSAFNWNEGNNWQKELGILFVDRPFPSIWFWI